MKRRFLNLNRQCLLACTLALSCCQFSTQESQAAERPTLNKNTCDPRPDIIPHPWYHSRTEYRRTYNRPRYVSGWIAQKIAPTSQEAMVWCENLRAGAYDEKHAPPRYKRFYGPKPWEVLQTGVRPDFAKPVSRTTPAPSRTEASSEELLPEEAPPATAEAQQDSADETPSPSDLPNQESAERVPSPVNN